MSRERKTEVLERARGAGDGSASDHGGWRAERAARLCLFLVLGVAFDEERGKGREGTWIKGAIVPWDARGI
jgi:hypothetical protein